MKKYLLSILLWVFALASASGVAAPAVTLQHLQPEAHQAMTAKIVSTILSRNHYRAPPLNHAMAGKIFDNYLQSLDPERSIFLQSDIDQFAPGRSTLDDALRAEDVSLPFTVYDIYRERLVERFSYAREQLKAPQDFKKKESFEFDRRTAPWLRNNDEAKELWRKRVKNDWLSLKLTGQTDEAIRKTLDKRYEGYLTRVGKSNANDVFQIFMDAYATTVDPHTNYFGPRASEEFEIAMKLSLVGIGAVLQARDNYTTIRELVPGGPAALSGKLKIGDRIVGVAQGNNAAVTEVIGWRLDDVVGLIRGALDTTVVLDILPEGVGPDGKHKLIALIRKKISIEQQAAKKSVIDVKEGATVRHIGVITLPSFYEDAEGERKGEKDFKVASRDVARLIGELKKEKIDGLIVDLRNNGGGSLKQAIDVTGLFIDQGPVVQQRDGQGRIGVESDTAAGYVWSGPLAVLINRASASASEIFAAAIQDYGRGVVLGETSFGKGTVQTLVNLNRALRTDKPAFGEIKLTVAEFFRINGASTQLLGVKPDIPFPAFSDMKHLGESSYENALPSSQIKPASYTPEGDLSSILPQLRVRHDARMASDKALKLVVQTAEDVTTLRKRTSISLNEAERRAERDQIDARMNRLSDNGGARAKAKTDASLANGGDPADDDSPKKLSPEEEKAKKAREPETILLNESAHILSDELTLLAQNPKLAEKVLPRGANSASAR